MCFEELGQSWFSQVVACSLGKKVLAWTCLSEREVSVGGPGDEGNITFGKGRKEKGRAGSFLHFSHLLVGLGFEGCGGAAELSVPSCLPLGFPAEALTLCLKQELFCSKSMDSISID